MSTKSTFAEQFGQRVRIRGVETVSGGSSAKLSLSPQGGFTATITVARALVRRGVKPTVAKSVVERLAAGHSAAVLVKHFDGEALITEFAALGVSAKELTEATQCLSEAMIRTRKEWDMSQDQFANLLGLPVSTLRNWEQARTRMDAPTRLLVGLITAVPEVAMELASLGFSVTPSPVKRAPRHKDRIGPDFQAKAHG